MLEKNFKGQLIVIGGLPASGKTTLGLGLADRIGDKATLIDGDAVWHHVHGIMPCRVDLTADQSRRWTGFILGLAARALCKDKTPIVVHHFGGPRQRKLVEYMPKLLGAEFRGFWLIAPKPVAVERACQRKQGQWAGQFEPNNFSIADASDSDPEEYARSVSRKWVRIDAGQSREAVLDNVWADLQSAAPPISKLSLGLPRAHGKFNLHHRQ